MIGNALRVGAVMLLCTATAQAYDFRPTAAEWKTWPDYCKAKYVITQVGERSPYRRFVSKDMITQWQGLLGIQTWTNIHHGCAGMIWIQRAERLEGKNAQQHDFAVSRAVDEATYSLGRTPGDHPVAHKLKMVMARADYSAGNTERALARMEEIVREAPEMAEGYAVLSTYLYREKKFDRAREVLEQGLTTVEEPTAEMHYFLGLVLLRQKAYVEARVQAEEAYRLGYPLPGLKRRLKSLGYWDT